MSGCPALTRGAACGRPVVERLTLLCGCDHLTQTEACGEHAGAVRLGGVVCGECRDKIPTGRHNTCRPVVIGSELIRGLPA